MRRFAAVSVLALTVLAGCGSSSKSSSSSGSASTPAPAPSTTTPAPSSPPPAGASGAASSLAVTETEFKLSPAKATAKPGKLIIKVKNAGATVHSLSVDNAGPGGKDAKSALLQPGQSGTVAVTLKAGKTYTWYCPVDGHRGMGMVGTIKVAANGTASVAPATGGSTSTTSSSTSGGSAAPGGNGY